MRTVGDAGPYNLRTWFEHKNMWIAYILLFYNSLYVGMVEFAKQVNKHNNGGPSGTPVPTNT